jgi:hypothetical protein
MKTILILQPYLDQSRAIAKFLKQYSHDYFIVGALAPDPSFITKIPFFDELRIVPLDYTVPEGEFDLILPTGAESTTTFVKMHDSFCIGTIPFHKENLRVCDKIPMLEIIRDMQIPVPETYRSADDIDAFPVFYKQKEETGRGPRGIVHNREELDTIIPDTSVFFQEFIDSPATYGVGFLARDGIMVTSFIQKELYSYPKPGGSGVILQSVEDKKLLEYTLRILRKLNFSGWGLVEFKYCPKRNDYVFMEVNAKMWASIEFALMNNPVFFRELFGICSQPEKKIRGVIFLDRLARYGITDYVRLWVKYMRYTPLHLTGSLRILAGNTLPVPLKKLLKRFTR